MPLLNLSLKSWAAAFGLVSLFYSRNISSFPGCHVFLLPFYLTILLATFQTSDSEELGHYLNIPGEKLWWLEPGQLAVDILMDCRGKANKNIGIPVTAIFLVIQVINLNRTWMHQYWALINVRLPAKDLICCQCANIILFLSLENWRQSTVLWLPDKIQDTQLCLYFR